MPRRRSPPYGRLRWVEAVAGGHRLLHLEHQVGTQYAEHERPPSSGSLIWVGCVTVRSVTCGPAPQQRQDVALLKAVGRAAVERDHVVLAGIDVAKQK